MTKTVCVSRNFTIFCVVYEAFENNSFGVFENCISSEFCEIAVINFTLFNPKVGIACFFHQNKILISFYLFLVMPEEAPVNSAVISNEPVKFYLKIYDKDRNFQKDHPLMSHTPTYVGRAIGCQIDLSDISVSRRHCVFQYKHLIMDPTGQNSPISGFCIYDLKSTHGTFLNGERIPSMQNIQLKPGDVIRFGSSECDFEFHEKEITESSNATADSTTEQQATTEPVEPQMVNSNSSNTLK